MRRTLAVAAILVLASPLPAHAYIDPGTGSVLLQMILGGLAGLIVVLKIGWSRLGQLLGRKPKNGENRSEA